MNDELIKKIIDGTYDDSKEDTPLSVVRDLYSRKMLSTAILVWGWAIIFFAGAAYSTMQFFKNVETKPQIMYAAIFVCCVDGIIFMKIYACEMIHRHSVKREIKKLELRIAELNETVKNR